MTVTTRLPLLTSMISMYGSVGGSTTSTGASGSAVATARPRLRPEFAPVFGDQHVRKRGCFPIPAGVSGGRLFSAGSRPAGKTCCKASLA